MKDVTLDKNRAFSHPGGRIVKVGSEERGIIGFWRGKSKKERHSNYRLSRNTLGNRRICWKKENFSRDGQKE